MRTPFVVGNNLDPAKLFPWIARAMMRGYSVQTLTADTTLPDGLATENVLYRCNAVGGAFTVTLPPSISSEDTRFILKKIDASANAVTWLRQGTDTVDGATTGTLPAQYNRIALHCRSGGFDIL